MLPSVNPTFLCVFNVFVELSIIRIDKVDASQLPRIIGLRFIDGPLLGFPFVELLHVSGPKWSSMIVAIFVSRSLDHKNPLGRFSFGIVNVNPVHESDKLRSTSTFQQTSIRLSCNTSNLVCVVPVTSMYFSGIGKVSSFGTKR